MSQPIIFISILIVYSSSFVLLFLSLLLLEKGGESYCIFHSLPRIVHPNLPKSGVVEGIVDVVVVFYKVNIYLTSKTIS